MDFEIGKKYNFFDDGKISLNRHYIAEVTDIIPFENFHMKNYICDEIDRYQDYKYLYVKEPEKVIVAKIYNYIQGPFFFIKMNNNTGNYFSTNDVYWDGELCTKQWCIDNIVNASYSNPELIKQLVL